MAPRCLLVTVLLVQRLLLGGTAAVQADTQPGNEFAATAKQASWWSRQPVTRPAVPELDDPWVRTPVDAFILGQLKTHGLSPSKEADRRTLIRRVTYDLIGLPPTPEEVDAFVSSAKPDAYARLVERLLASPQYGERWARHWLDIVQYADTCGYDKDKLRPNAWPYRDYVIRSLNTNKPYDRFVREQIAGDVLFPGEPDSIVALGFIAAGPWDFIGHVEVPESKIDGKVARNLDRDNMVTNTMNTFCSVTVQCARCHDHKFDPISQKQYYGLQAIFAAVDRAERPYDRDPAIARHRQQLEARLATVRAEQQAMEAEIAAAGGEGLATLRKRIAVLTKKQAIQKSPAFGYHSAIVKEDDAVKWVEVDLGKTVEVSHIILNPCHDDFAGIGAGFGFPVRFKVELARERGQWQTVYDQTSQDYPNPGLAPVNIAVTEHKARWVRVTATKLAERRKDYIFALAELQVLDGTDQNLARGASVNALDSIEAPVRWARKNLIDGQWARGSDPKVSSQLAQAIEVRDTLLAEIETRARKQQRALLQKTITRTQQQLQGLPSPQRVYAAATHFPAQGNFKPTQGRPRPIHVLHRGDVQHPGSPVTPAVLPLQGSAYPLEPNASDAVRRATLARWLTDPNHPLVWRSIVNRVWQYHFGKGLVATPNDFGRMGARPTHSELLDWLASEFRDRGQSLKQLHRLIVTSSTYCQSSHIDSARAAVDRNNRWLWRMDRRRLEAEEIRDSILTVSGALNPAMGGPGFYLFALEKTEHSPHYEYHKFDPADSASHRRSIYRFIVRSQPNPWMTTLDCADSAQSTPKRNETLTSLQALALLNNRFNLVMAERFARRLQRETASSAGQIERAMRLITQRSPTPAEQAAFKAYAQKHGLANLCRLLFNLSEFVYLD